MILIMNVHHCLFWYFVTTFDLTYLCISVNLIFSCSPTGCAVFVTIELILQYSNLKQVSNICSCKHMMSLYAYSFSHRPYRCQRMRQRCWQTVLAPPTTVCYSCTPASRPTKSEHLNNSNCLLSRRWVGAYCSSPPPIRPPSPTATWHMRPHSLCINCGAGRTSTPLQRPPAL